METHNLHVDDIVLPIRSHFVEIQSPEWDNPASVNELIQHKRARFILSNYSFEIDKTYTLPLLAEALAESNLPIYIIRNDQHVRVILEQVPDTRLWKCTGFENENV